jgi:hypothetical protein
MSKTDHQPKGGTRPEPRQRHVWAVVWAKGNQRRTRGLYSSAERARAAVEAEAPGTRQHLELEQMEINGPA